MNAHFTCTPGNALDCDEAAKAILDGRQSRLAAQPRSLGRGELYSVMLETGETVRFEGEQGLCWVTMEGDPVDYVVEAGVTLRFHGPGLLLIEGMRATNGMRLETV